MEEHEIQPSGGQAKWLGWAASMLVSLDSLFACLVLVRSMGIFSTLFQGLGVELPGATRFLLATYVWLFPVFFVGAAVLVIAKEFVMRDVRGRLAATLLIFVTAASFVGMVVFVLYLPLLELVRKLASK
jgi:type II secretory pathway component PulF